MFGSIGTFNASGSKFNSTAGDQTNISSGALTASMGAHPTDPRFRQYTVTSTGTRPATRTNAPMFADVGEFHADGSVFNHAAGDQTNYLDGHSATNIPQPLIVHAPATQSAPSPHVHNASSFGTAPSSTEAKMFTRIDHFQAPNSEYNSSAGNQVNILGASGVPAPAPAPAPNPLGGYHGAIHGAPPTASHTYNQYQYPSTSGASGIHGAIPTATHTYNQYQSPLTSGASGIQQNHSELVDTTLGVADLVLTTLQTAAQVSPVPFLKEAASAALIILAGLQGLKDNKEGFERVCKNACNLITSAVLFQEKRAKEGRDLPPEMVSNLEDLVRNLRPIAEFMKKRSKRNGVRRFVLHKTDAGKIAEYQQKLTAAVSEFQVRSHMNTEGGVAQLDKRLDDLVAALHQRYVLPGTPF